MLHSTRGIVFNQVKYGETSIIVKIYTEQLGLQSYLVRGARSRKAKIRAAHLQHLTLVDLEVDQRNNKNIQHLKNLKIAFPFKDIPFNIRKSAVVVFLNEMLYNVIQEEEQNPELFEFLFHTIQFLDMKPGNLGLFHHLFLIRLSKFLGFYPRNDYSSHRQNFDLQEGSFTSISGPENLIASPPLSEYLHQMLSLNFENIDAFIVPPSARNQLLEMILNYYRLHVAGFRDIKSHAVLSEVFGD